MLAAYSYVPVPAGTGGIPADSLPFLPSLLACTLLLFPRRAVALIVLLVYPRRLKLFTSWQVVVVTAEKMSRVPPQFHNLQTVSDARAVREREREQHTA